MMNKCIIWDIQVFFVILPSLRQLHYKGVASDNKLET